MTYLPWKTGPYEVVFTTRLGGVSEGPYASLNLGRKTGDDVERVDENRRRACAEIGVDDERLALNYQMHSALVHRAEPGSRGERGDGLWTDEPDSAGARDERRLPADRARADERGLAGGRRSARGVARPARRHRRSGRRRARRRCARGRDRPAIGPCCYEVRDDVAEPFRARFGDDIVRDGKLDLWRAAELALSEAGVTHVERLDLCTSCHPELFFSHRRDGKPRGVQGVLARVA